MIQLKGIRGGIDKTGLATLTAAFIAQDITYEQALVAVLPVTLAIPEDSRTIEDWVTHDNFTINATFKGILERAPGKDSPLTEEYSFEEEFMAKPIETHPQIDRLMEKYQGTRNAEGRIQWALNLGSGKGSGTGLGRGKAGTDVNPMFGTTEWQELHLVAVHTYTVRQLPSDFRSRVGSIREGLPGGFELANNSGKWLIRPGSAQRIGDTGWKVTDRYVDVTDIRAEVALRELLKK